MMLSSYIQVGGLYDAYGSYIPGFLGVGTLGVLGALILPAIALALPQSKTGQNETN